MSQSTHAVQSLMRGDPLAIGDQPSPANLSAPFCANTRHTSSWSSPRTLTQNAPASRIAGHDDDDFPMQKPTSGGSSDTEKKEPIAVPLGPLSPPDAMITTPVGKWPSTCR